MGVAEAEDENISRFVAHVFVPVSVVLGESAIAIRTTGRLGDTFQTSHGVFVAAWCMRSRR
jgi:hypothetical protein